VQAGLDGAGDRQHGEKRGNSELVHVYGWQANTWFVRVAGGITLSPTVLNEIRNNQEFWGLYSRWVIPW
jgi:hypothetical protein